MSHVVCTKLINLMLTFWCPNWVLRLSSKITQDINVETCNFCIYLCLGCLYPPVFMLTNILASTSCIRRNYNLAYIVLLVPKSKRLTCVFAFRSFCPLKKVTGFRLPWAARSLYTSWCSIVGRRRETTDQNLLTSSASLTNWSAIPVPFTPWWRTSSCKMHGVDFFPLIIISLRL